VIQGFSIGDGRKRRKREDINVTIGHEAYFVIDLYLNCFKVIIFLNGSILMIILIYMYMYIYDFLLSRTNPFSFFVRLKLCSFTVLSAYIYVPQ